MRFIILLVLFLPELIYSQFYSIDFPIGTKICTEDNVEYQGLEGWNTYQTNDNSFDGDKTLLCEEDISDGILFTGYEVNKPIFIRNIDPLNLALESNQLYSFAYFARLDTDNICDCDQQCSTVDCISVTLITSGLIDGAPVRDTIVVDNYVLFSDFQSMESCLLVNKSVDQKIEEIIIKFVPIVENIFPIELRSLTINKHFDILDAFEVNSQFTNRVVSDELKITSNYLVSPTYFLEDTFLCCEGSVKVLHDIPGLPSKNNIHTYLLVPEDSTTQNAITILNDNSEKLEFQRHTRLRGAVVANQVDTSLRHRVSLVSAGDFCLGFEVELVNQDDNEFRFRSGSITLGDSRSCIMFKDKSRLVVEEEAELQYGRNGNGAIAFGPGTSIVLEEGSTFDFGGRFVLLPGDDSQTVSLHLGPNQKLKFSNRATLEGPLGAKLTIYMEGGLLDISELNADYLPFLNIIYPENLTLLESDMTIFPNPVSDIVNVYSGEPLTDIRLVNITGQSVSFSLYQTDRLTQLDISSLDAGLYFLRIGNTKTVHRIIKN